MTVSRKSTAGGIFHAFLENTVMHGAGDISREDNRSLIRRGIWAVLVIVFIGVSIGMVTGIVRKYFDYPVQISIDVVFTPQIDFPTVTICNVNPIRRDILDKYKNRTDVQALMDVIDDIKETNANNPYSVGGPGDCQPGAGGPPVPGGPPPCRGGGGGPPGPPAPPGPPGPPGPPNGPPTGPPRPPTQKPGPMPGGMTTQFGPFIPTRPKPRDQEGTATPEYFHPFDRPFIKLFGLKPTEPDELSDVQYDDAKTNSTATSTLAEDDETWWSKLEATENLYTQSFSSGKLYKQFLEVLNSIEPEDFRMILGHQKYSMIMSCSFGGYVCTPKNFTTTWNYRYGNCHSFNAGWNSSIPVRKITQPGPLHGLSLDLFVEKEQYVKEVTANEGLKIVIHSKDRMPFPEDEGMNIFTDTQTNIGVRMLNIVRLPYPYPSNCLTGSQPRRNAYVNDRVKVFYSTQSCTKTCIQSEMISRCRCANVEFAIVSSAFDSISGWVGNERICNSSLDKEAACQNDVMSMYENHTITCNCPQSCHDITFASTISISRWPSREVAVEYAETLSNRSKVWKEMLNVTINDGVPDNDPMKQQEISRRTNEMVSLIQRNLMKLQIYYEDLNYELIEQNAAYEPNQVLNDVGGQVGLWLGLSFIAIFEIVELIIDLIWYLTGQRVANRRKIFEEAVKSKQQTKQTEPKKNATAKPYSRSPLVHISY